MNRPNNKFKNNQSYQEYLNAKELEFQRRKRLISQYQQQLEEEENAEDSLEEEYNNESGYSESENYRYNSQEKVGANNNSKQKNKKQKNANSSPSLLQRGKNPVNRLKQGTKKTIKIAKKTKSLLNSFLGKYKIYILIGSVILFLFFLLILMSLDMFVEAEDGGGSSNSSSQTGYSANSCEYNVGSADISDIQVELINCDGKSENYTVLETVPLEKYVLGVALAEIGPGSSDEAIKAQIIMARNFALTRNQGMCPSNSNSCFFGYNASDDVIRLRACENDQVYWDYTQDIYRLTINNSKANYFSDSTAEKTLSFVKNSYSNITSVDSLKSNSVLWKSALSTEEITKYESLASSVIGELAVNTTGSIIKTGYNADISNQAEDLAASGYDYVQILQTIYPDVNRVSAVSCEYKGSIDEIGDYANWKQMNAPWSDIVIYDDTIGNIGCAATSVAIIIARSGVETTIENLNPGTFVEAYKKVGGFSGNGIRFSEVGKVTYNKLQLISDDGKKGRPDLYYSPETKKAHIKELIEDGCLVIMQVKSGGNNDTHFVAIDDISTKASGYTNYYMWDPGNTRTNDLFAKYERNAAWGYRYLCYKVVE